MDSIEIVNEFLEAENKRDWQRWASYLDQNVLYVVIGSETSTKGKNNYIQKMQNAYSELVDWSFRILNIVGNKEIVFVEFEGRGRFTGQEGGKKYIDIPLVLNAVDLFKIKDGLIYEVREYFDYKSYKQQLSLKEQKSRQKNQ